MGARIEGSTRLRLIERARAGDDGAFEELARERVDGVYQMALGILGSRADALDATQEALVSMWRGLPSLRHSTAFDSWLYRITVNASYAVIRRRKGVREISFLSDVSPVNQPVADWRGFPAKSKFDHAFERLGADQRALLLAHHVDGVSVAELARLLDVPEGTVKSRLHRARTSLELALERDI